MKLSIPFWVKAFFGVFGLGTLMHGYGGFGFKLHGL